MRKLSVLIVSLLALMPARATAQISGIAGYLLVGRSTVAAMPAANTVVRGLWIVIDDADCDALTVDDGVTVCVDEGATWAVIAGGGGAPDAHASTHQDGGSDEINVAGLTGLLATAQTPAAHTQASTTISDSTVAGRALLTAADAAAQRTALALGTAATKDVPAAGNAASGEVVQGNDTRLTDTRTPTSHATTHQHNGTDEIATATPGANAIPKAGSGGTIAAGWVPTLNQSTTGNAATATALAANPAPCNVGDFVTDIAADGTLTCDTPAGGGSSSGTTLQVGDGAGGFAALTSSSVSGADVTLGGTLLMPAGSYASPAVRVGSNGAGIFDEASVGLALKPGSGGYIRFYGKDGAAKWHVHTNTYDIVNSTGTGGTAVMAFAAASGTVPVWTFNGDADTGLGRSADNTLSIIAGGTEAVRATASKVTIAGVLGITPKASAPSTCTAATDIYTDTSGALCFCTATDTWTNVSGVGSCA